jgi:hypothetical protein
MTTKPDPIPSEELEKHYNNGLKGHRNMGREAFRRLRALRERHQQAIAGWDSRGNQNSPTSYCKCGHPLPCPDRELIEGRG